MRIKLKLKSIEKSNAYTSMELTFEDSVSLFIFSINILNRSTDQLSFKVAVATRLFANTVKEENQGVQRLHILAIKKKRINFSL